MQAAAQLFDRIINKKLSIRRMYITAAKVVPDCGEESAADEQMDLFTDYEERARRNRERSAENEREKKRQKAVLEIRGKYGKNAVLKGISLEEGATAISRNGQIGGHKA